MHTLHVTFTAYQKCGSHVFDMYNRHSAAVCAPVPCTLHKHDSACIIRNPVFLLMHITRMISYWALSIIARCVKSAPKSCSLCFLCRQGKSNPTKYISTVEEGPKGEDSSKHRRTLQQMHGKEFQLNKQNDCFNRFDYLGWGHLIQNVCLTLHGENL